MSDIATGARILVYSHDTFGLGHLRRCRAIAHSLVEHNPTLSVLIISGSPIIGSFDFRARVDFVRIPGVVKRRDGEYTPLNLHIDIHHTLAIRSSIIRHTAEIFEPHLFLVDKEPLGLRGEVHETLTMLKARGTPLVLGLRDVMDEPGALGPEWQRKNAMPALRDLYDEVWVYGLPQICDPLAGIDLPRATHQKVAYTGYLPRTSSPIMPRPHLPDYFDEPYILVTTGGGGDGEALIDWVLSAYEADPGLPNPALLVLGPFMPPEIQAGFIERSRKVKRVQALTFDTHLESLMANAVGVVAMGGYNTFCEILSFDKRALIVPRTVPRMEQYIRATRAAELGLIHTLPDDGERNAQTMATALRRLPEQPKPSTVTVPGLMDGLKNVNRLTDRWLSRPRPALVAGASRHA